MNRNNVFQIHIKKTQMIQYFRDSEFIVIFWSWNHDDFEQQKGINVHFFFWIQCFEYTRKHEKNIILHVSGSLLIVSAHVKRTKISERIRSITMSSSCREQHMYRKVLQDEIENWTPGDTILRWNTWFFFCHMWQNSGTLSHVTEISVTLLHWNIVTLSHVPKICFFALILRCWLFKSDVCGIKSLKRTIFCFKNHWITAPWRSSGG